MRAGRRPGRSMTPRSRWRATEAGRVPAQRASRAWRIAATGMVFALLTLLLLHPFAPRIERGMLEITAIDVGQGDSILIAFPDGKLMLMDGGGIPAFGRRVKSKLDIAEDVAWPYLWSRSIQRLDVVALSHAHEDHIGGQDGAPPHLSPWGFLTRTT